MTHELDEIYPDLEDFFEEIQTESVLPQYKDLLDKLWKANQLNDQDYIDEINRMLDDMWIELSFDERIDATDHASNISNN